MSSFFIKSNNPQKINDNSSKGFSLVELMVAITVAAIMITIAVPSLGNFIVKVRVDNEISQLNRLVLTARNSAVTTGQIVIVCPLANNGACTNNWSNEITAFIDLDNDGVFTNDPVTPDTLLKIKAATSGGDAITYGGASIMFRPTGALAGAVNAGTFLYCPRSDKSLGRAIVLSLSGRTYLTTDADNDGYDEFSAGGGNVICP